MSKQSRTHRLTVILHIQKYLPCPSSTQSTTTIVEVSNTTGEPIVHSKSTLATIDSLAKNKPKRFLLDVPDGSYTLQELEEYIAKFLYLRYLIAQSRITLTSPWMFRSARPIPPTIATRRARSTIDRPCATIARPRGGPKRMSLTYCPLPPRPRVDRTVLVLFIPYPNISGTYRTARAAYWYRTVDTCSVPHYCTCTV